MRIIRHAGFTIIETMVAIAILGTMLFAAITLVVQVNESMIHQKRLVGATYLLQECHEMVRNIRDSLWKQNLPWSCAFYHENVSEAFAIQNDPFPTTSSGTTIPACADRNSGSAVSHLVGSFVNLKPFVATDTIPFEQKFGNETYERRITFVYTDSNGTPSAGNPPDGCESPFNTPEKVKNCSEVTVNCKVSWDARGGAKEISMVSILTDWFKR